MKSKSSLNHVFRSVWSHALGAMVAVAEIAGGRGQGASSGVGGSGAATPCRLAALPLCIALAWGAAVPAVWANPAGGVVIQGQATFDASQANKLLVTTQNAPGTSQSAINWQSFSIPVGNTTYFQQPSATSTSINRVVTSTPSQLFGTLGSNGNLVLVNQAGIAVGAGAVVDTAGFTASALQMTEADALAGRLRFGDGSTSGGAVSVLGSILARSGDVVLLGANVSTGADALVQSPNGAISLVAGSAVSISARGLEGINFEVQAPTDSAVNLGTLKGDAVGIFAGTLKHSGLIQATTAAMEGGKVVLKASGDAYVEGAGKITATGGKGGAVDVLGNRVAVTDQAAIDVSGTYAGGTVRIGGDYQGKNTAVPNANVTYFGPQASVKADATDQGNGGKVIVWADDTTRAYGSISAKGGANGGDGGFVETSGHNYLSVAGARVDTQASLGHTGNWLLDPFDIQISHGVATTPNPPSFDGTGLLGNLITTTSSLTDADINLQLATTDVTISTNPLGTGTGYGGVVGITVGAGVVIANPAAAARSLTLQSDNNIVVTSASIAGAAGKPLNVTLSAAGAIDLTTTTINSFGGAIVLGGATTPLSTAAVGNSLIYQNGVRLSGLTFINAGTGNIDIRGTGVADVNSTNSGIAISANSSLTTTSGNITLVGTGGANTGAFANKYGVYLEGGSIRTGNGSISITGTGGSGGMFSNMGVFLDGGSIISTGTPGTISITGSGGVGSVGAMDYGVLLSGGTAGLTISSLSGAITLHGAATGDGAEGIRAFGFGKPISISSAGAAPISLFGEGAGIASQSSIQLDGSGGAITIGGTTASGALSFTAGGVLEDIAIGADVTIQSAGSLTMKPLTPATSIGIGGGAGTFNLTTSEMASFADGFADITIGSATQSGAINVVAAAFTDNVTLWGGGASAINVAGVSGVGGLATSLGGAIKLVGGSITNTGTISSADGSISLVADAMTLAGGTISATGNDSGNINNPGSVFLTTNDPNKLITLGGTDSGLNLSSAALQTITATNGLVIGGDNACGSSPGFCVGASNSGGVTVSGATNLTSVGGAWGLELITTGQITVSAALSALNQSVTLYGQSISNTGVISGSRVALTADTMSLNGGYGGTITAGAGGVDLHAYTQYKAISLGIAGTNTLDILNDDLRAITSTGGLRIGDSGNTPGDVDVNGPITAIDLAGLTAGTLVLQSATGSVSVNAELTSPVPIELSTGNNLSINGNVTANSGSVVLRVGNILSVGNGVSITASDDMEIAPFGNSRNMWIDSLNGCDGEFCLDPSVLPQMHPNPVNGALILGRSVADISYTGTTTLKAGTTIDSSMVNGVKLALNGKNVVIEAADLVNNPGVLAASIGSTTTAFDKPLDILANQNITTNGDIYLATGQNLLLGADGYWGGSVTGTGAMVVPGTLTVNAYSGISLYGANNVGTLIATNSGYGNLTFDNSGSLTLGNVSDAEGTIAITSGGSITQAGNLSTAYGGNITLTAATDLTMQPGVTTTANSSSSITYTATSGAVALGSGKLDADISVTVNAGTNITGAAPTTGNILTASGYGGIALNAGTAGGAGTVDADTRTVSLVVNNSTATVASNISVRNTGSALAATVYASPATAQLTITNDNTINVGHIAGATNTTLTTTGSRSDITVAQACAGQCPLTLLSNGNISMNAGGNILVAHDRVESFGGTVTAQAGGNITLDSQGYTTSIKAASGISLTAGGGVYLYGDITDHPSLDITGAGNIDIFTGTGGFNNGVTADGYGGYVSGYGGLVNATNGRWRIWVDDFSKIVQTTQVGETPLAANYLQYDAVNTTAPVAGNGFMYRLVQPSLTPTMSGTLSKIYDGTLSISTSGAAFSCTTGCSGYGGDLVTGAQFSGGAGLLANANVGSWGVSVSGLAVTGVTNSAGLPICGYGATSSGSGTVTPARATASISLSGTRQYDGTNVVNANMFLLSGLVGTETLTLSGAGTVADKNVGVDKPVSLGTLVLGNDTGLASNYTFSGGTAKATITQANISTVSGITAANKTYDGTTDASLNTGAAAFAGKIATDTLTVGSATGVFADKTAGLGKTVNITGITLSGADAGNYTLGTATATTTANIDKATISAVGGITAANKTYDGKTDAQINTANASFTGQLSSDSLSVTNAVGAFADKNAAIGKTVNITGIALGGADAGNYTLGTSTASTTATIDKATLSAVSGITAAKKTYDGKTDAQLNTSTAAFVGKIATDSLTIGSATGAFVDKAAGANKTVNISAITLSGQDAGNYSLQITTATTTATIDKATISAVSGITAANKTYDGKTDAQINTANASITGQIAGDNLTLTGGVGAFEDKNAATGKTVNITGLALGGAAAGNYTLGTTATTATTATATIDKAALTELSGLTAANKTYDGKTDAQINATNASFAEKVAGDSLSVTGAVGAFVDKNAAIGKTVNITGITLGGADAGNYKLGTTAITTTANIDKATLSAVSGITAVNKSYDGKTDAQINVSNASFAEKVAGDSLSVTGAVGAFVDKNAATGKTVNITGIALSGADAGNYLLGNSRSGATAVADIKPKELVVSGVTAANKVYDGKLDATLNTATATLAGQIDGDFVSISAADIKGAFADKNVGTAKVVNLSGLKLAGADAGNYVAMPQTDTKADITARPSSTWTGAAGNNSWSDAGNWDALPDGVNVLSVNIGNIGAGSGTVTFDSGSVTLQNLSSAQTLSVGGGTLQVSGALTTSGFSQTAGTVSGAGSFTASGAFNQTGGSIDMANIAATQSSGNMTINNLKAPSVNLTGGSISQTAGGGIETTTLTTQSTGGTVLTGTGNKMANWNAFNAGSGALRLINTGLITVTAINDGGDFNIESFGGVVTKGQVKSSGAISITANSPLVIGPQGLSAAGNILLTATNLTSAGNITLDGPIVSSSGSVAMKAASNLTQNSSINAPLGVAVEAAGALVLGPLAVSGVLPVIYVVASQPVAPPPRGAISSASDAVVALTATSHAIETPAEKQVLAAAAVPVKKKDDDKDTSKEPLVSEAAGICRP